MLAMTASAVPVHSMSQPWPTRSRSQPPRMGPKDCPKRSMEPAIPCMMPCSMGTLEKSVERQGTESP